MAQRRIGDPRQILTIDGTTWCPDCKCSMQFLGDRRVRYRWVDTERDPEAMAYVEQINDGKRIAGSRGGGRGRDGGVGDTRLLEGVRLEGVSL